LSRLFKEAFTTKADGSGIGLTTCRRFVREHGGYIGVSSKLNVGTEFRVLLPGVPAQAHLEDAVEQAPIPLQTGEGRVMIVEDECALRHVARCILTRCGYEVVEAENGEAALRLYKEESRSGRTPDVVLMDLTLPGGLSGGEVARGILAFDPQANLVVTSGSVTEDVQRAYLDEGFCGVLPKPYEAGALTMTVRMIIENATRDAHNRVG
jgi:CheY-like chemotaxis protein